MVRNTDGRWTALHSTLLFSHSKTAGSIYEVELRHRLTRRLGVEWGPVENGIGDIAGIPPELLRSFSKRRAQIEAQLDTLGYSSPRAAEIAALDTRQPKTPGTSPLYLRDRWADEARGFGYEPAALVDVLHRVEPAPLSETRVKAIQEWLASPHGLTARSSQFDRRHVVMAWCDQLPAGRPASEVEALADEFLARSEVVSLPEVSGPGPASRDTANRDTAGKAKAGMYSTRELLALERRLVDDAVSRRHDTVGTVQEADLAAALSARPTLSDEQARLVANLTSSGAGVQIVSAAAGTGKTFCLDAARDAWQRAGYTVIGCSLAARAAAQLDSSAGIRSSTIARLLIDLDRQHGALADRSVLVVDEAAMVDSRTMARLLGHAYAANAKVVLVGDEGQLPEIGAGGAFRGLLDRLDALTLTENRRQREAWERNALRELRDGDVDTALAAYTEHGRVVTATTAPEVRHQLVADWWAATLAGEHAQMIAARWVDVDDLNVIARARMIVDDRLDGPELVAGDRTFQTGDRVLALRNDTRRGVRNGSLGSITAVDVEARSLLVRFDTGEHIELPTRYLDDGHLTHGYASTAHKSQGLTCDRALLLGNDALYRELGYVGLSRGRLGNHLYVVSRDADETPEHNTTHLEPKPIELVTSALKRSRAQQLAIDTLDTVPERGDLGALLRERRSLLAVLATRPPDPQIEFAALTNQRADTEARLHDAEERLARLGPRRLRERLGHLNPDRVVVDTAIDNAHKAIDRLDHAKAQLDEQADALDDFNTAHAPETERLQRVTQLARAQFARHMSTIGRNPPAHLLGGLGNIPEDRGRAKAWWHSAKAVEGYRIEADITTPDDLLGDRPRDPVLASRRSAVETTVRLDKLQLRPTPERSLGRSLG